MPKILWGSYITGNANLEVVIKTEVPEAYYKYGIISNVYGIQWKTIFIGIIRGHPHGS